MRKKIVLSLVSASILAFTGCSQKDVEVDTEETVTKPAVEKKAEEQPEQPMQSAQEETVVTNDSSMAETEEKKVLQEKLIVPTLENIYFDYDKYVLKSDMRSVLKTNYKMLEESQYANTITLEGYCDERGSDEYNFALGLKRAETVKKELISYGVDSKQIKLVSYGETKPLCTDKTEDCWNKNRRVETVLK